MNGDNGSSGGYGGDGDNNLMQKSIEGDQSSFEELVIRHMDNAIFFAKRYVQDIYVAEEVVQESFADIYVNIERYRDNYSFKTYLYTIIKNKCIDYIRKNTRLDTYQHVEQEGMSAEEIALNKERWSIFGKAFGKLKSEYKTVIYLYAYEEFSYEEISKIMGKNMGQIKILLYRARQSLKNRIEEEG